MSEYKCPEPGCEFHIGSPGEVLTEEDYDAQMYYFGETQDHEQMHRKQREEAIAQSRRLELHEKVNSWEHALDHHRRNQVRIALSIADRFLEGKTPSVLEMLDYQITKNAIANGAQQIQQTRQELEQALADPTKEPPAVAAAEGDETNQTAK